PDTVSAVIEDMIVSDNPDESIIVLSCDKLTYNLVQRRVERVELILNDYNGIRVPREAIRFDKNNEKGVYILLGQKISFKKIDAVFECDEYILSRITSDASFVSVYDDIITSGEISSDFYVEEDESEPEQDDDIPEETAKDIDSDNVSDNTENDYNDDSNDDNADQSDIAYDDIFEPDTE
ncbi:MAG: hypothetical protein K2H23_01710, partial [Oscillospiraceae bacterium]|nr:hypothetical protein [Oscillospiraceae bacterium]